MSKGIGYALGQMSWSPDQIGENLRLVLRGLQILLLERMSKSAVYSVPFGHTSFKFKFIPLGPGKGSRGLFFRRETYEPLLQYGHELIQPGDVVLDCGANQGTYTCAFGAAVGSSGRVIAVEPIPEQVGRCRANIELNGFHHCKVAEGAISDQVGRAFLDMSKSDVEASIVPVEQSDQMLEVNTHTIDALVQSEGLERVDLIKLDVEGAEGMAIDGGRKTIDTFAPIIVSEANRSTAVNVTERLMTIGYRPFLRTDAGYVEVDVSVMAECVFFLPDRAVDTLKNRVRIEFRET
jgi:FkbM family methyltransferase